MAIVDPNIRPLQIKPSDSRVVVPPWYRPGYARKVRQAAWRNLRPKFRSYLRRKHQNGAFKFYRPDPMWVASRVGARPGVPQVFQEAPAQTAVGEEVILPDLEPAALTEEGRTPLEWLWDRPLVFVGLVTGLTLGSYRLYKHLKE